MEAKKGMTGYVKMRERQVRTGIGMTMEASAGIPRQLRRSVIAVPPYVIVGLDPTIYRFPHQSTKNYIFSRSYGVSW